MLRNKIVAGAVVAGVVRLAAGVALGGRPDTYLRWEPTGPDGSSSSLMLRTVGIRDFALGLGTLDAVVRRNPADVRRWVVAGAISDVLDVAAGVAAARTIGRRGLVSAAVAAPMVVLDAWALSR